MTPEPMKQSELKPCTDCQLLVRRWFTSYNDERPFCEMCATRRYKEKYPLTWKLSILWCADVLNRRTDSQEEA